MTEGNQRLIQTAIDILPSSYAPYSNFNVACIVVTENNEEFIGVNVENASYGLTICAERSAIVSMIPKCTSKKIKKIIVLSKSKVKTPPCGACRQFIAEFASDNCEVILPHGSSYQNITTHQFKELLPHSFSLNDD